MTWWKWASIAVVAAGGVLAYQSKKPEEKKEPVVPVAVKPAEYPAALIESKPSECEPKEVIKEVVREVIKWKTELKPVFIDRDCPIQPSCPVLEPTPVQVAVACPVGRCQVDWQTGAVSISVPPGVDPSIFGNMKSTWNIKRAYGQP